MIFLKTVSVVRLAAKQFIGTNQNVLKWLVTTVIYLSVDPWMMSGEYGLSTVIGAWSAMVTDNCIDFESLFFPYITMTLYLSINYHITILFFRADQLLLDDIAFWYVNLSSFCRPKVHVSLCHHLSFSLQS